MKKINKSTTVWSRFRHEQPRHMFNFNCSDEIETRRLVDDDDSDNDDDDDIIYVYISCCFILLGIINIVTSIT